MQNKCWCGSHRNHGGDKKLAAEHSKIAQARFAEEKEKFEKLNGKVEKTKYIPKPFGYIKNKNGGIRKLEFL